MNNQPSKTKPKQTQTKPILPAMAGKIALSAVEGPVGSLPALSLPVVSLSNQSNGSNQQSQLTCEKRADLIDNKSHDIGQACQAEETVYKNVCSVVYFTLKYHTVYKV